MKYLIANWKANKNIKEVRAWMNDFENELAARTKLRENLQTGRISIVICPPAPFLSLLRDEIKKKHISNVFVGAQDISAFENGPYTGEVTAASVDGLADFVIVGHSERRKYNAESDKTLFLKSAVALQYNIKTIFCVRNAIDPIPQDIFMLAYEPVNAIGTGNNELVENVLEMRKKMNVNKKIKFCYGGSINEKNAHQVYYKDYMIATGESTMKIEAQLHSKSDNWLGE